MPRSNIGPGPLAAHGWRVQIKRSTVSPSPFAVVRDTQAAGEEGGGVPPAQQAQQAQQLTGVGNQAGDPAAAASAGDRTAGDRAPLSWSRVLQQPAPRAPPGVII